MRIPVLIEGSQNFTYIYLTEESGKVSHSPVENEKMLEDFWCEIESQDSILLPAELAL